MDSAESKFTFLTYDSPNHNAFHRRTVKSHISSKYRIAVRRQKLTRKPLTRGHITSYPLPSESQQDGGTNRTEHSGQQITPNGAEEVVTRLMSKILFPRADMAFAGTRHDPFKSFPGEYTPCVSSALDYYTQVLTPLHEPLLNTLDLVNPMIVWVFPLMLQHPGVFHGAVAMSQAYAEKCRSPGQRPSKEVDFHRWKVVSTLREELRDLTGAPSDAALLMVLALACLDVFYHEPRTVNRTALGLLVAMRGGLNNLGRRGLIKAYFTQFDFFWMLEAGGQTMFPLARRTKERVYPEHPFSPELCTLISGLPQGFHPIACERSLGTDVLHFLSRVSRFLNSKMSNEAVHESGEIFSDRHWPDIFDTCSCLQLSTFGRNSLEKNTCLALILFSFCAHDPSLRTAFTTPFRGSRQELTKWLPQSQPETSDECNCLIWIWMLTISSWRLKGSLEETGLQLSRHFFNMYQGVSSWDTLSPILRSFFWYEPLAETWKLCWSEAYEKWRSSNRSASTSSDVVLRFSHPSPLPNEPLRSPYGSRVADRDELTRNIRQVSISTDTSGNSVTSPNSDMHTPANSVGDQQPGPLPPILTLETFLGQVQ